MSAEAVAAKARNPQHVRIEAPEDLSAHAKTEPSSQPTTQPSPSPFANGAVREVKSDAGLRGSSQDSGSTTSRPGIAHASLPPEILGLYNRSDPQDRQPSNPTLQEGLASNGRLDEDLEGPNPFAAVNGTRRTGPMEHKDCMVVEPVWGPATLDSCPVIMIPKNFSPKEGAKLTDDLVVGKHISSGLQGGVYDLLNLDGTKANMVFKLVHPHAPLAEVEREWEVGMRLNQLAEVNGSLPGFMGVGAGIRGGGKFRGMLLERLHGRTVNKVICTRDFHDVHYIYAMLYSIFTALDRAQGALGFHHSDLRLANVMEITPPSDVEEAQTGEPKSANERHLAADMEQLEAHPEQQGGSLHREKLRHQFKIIDYGLANFDETFAAGPDVVIEDDRDSAASRRSINLQRQQSISPASGCVAVFPFPMMKKERLGDLPSTSALEKLYRYMWRRKGDVYHLVFELGEWLDGRVWPSEDELDVLRMVDLIEHLTGVRMKYWFSDETGGENSVAGWRDRALGPFERHDSAMHFLRRWHVRLRSWVHPSNPSLTAAEALTAPFFTKRISLRGVIHGCSTRYSKWTTKHTARKKSGASNRPVSVPKSALGAPEIDLNIDQSARHSSS